MTLISSLSTIGVLLAAMVLLSLVEALIPLHARGPEGRAHLGPNLALTLITFATNLVFNVPLVLGLAWLQAHGLGLFNALSAPAAAAVLGSVIVLDFAWYVTHVSLHRAPALWRFHSVHHSDPAVDVTTTIRQHPGESLIRYLFLAGFAFAVGAPPAGFALYRIWSALHGQTEHANLRLPQWLDTAISALFASPNMHKVHHSRDRRLHDRNYGNIFSVWDRLFGTFIPAREGRDIRYGLDGFEAAERQSTAGLLALPFQQAGRVAAAAAASPTGAAQ
jgi:sterol desaturase/sphingolipid hydroxylase (fatty acid hydroxylase superfamily)